jgi:hypothetical protein
MKAFLQEYAGSPLIVTSVIVGRAGSVSILFTEGHALEIFPDDSIVGEYCEHWRFFKPGLSDKHFVITGNGIGT